MDQRKQNLRREAAKAFMASLNDLQDVFTSDAKQTSEATANNQKASVPSPEKSRNSILDDFEQAAKDIEALMEAQEG
ncbi:MAG TPA: hypothetical protein V6D28_21530 [Leptolyngbyaceae cyanobacterium]